MQAWIAIWPGTVAVRAAHGASSSATWRHGAIECRRPWRHMALVDPNGGQPALPCDRRGLELARHASDLTFRASDPLPVARCLILGATTPTCARRARTCATAASRTSGDGPAGRTAWLDPSVDLDGALELVRPLPDGRVEIYAVSARVNNARSQDADLTEPLSASA